MTMINKVVTAVTLNPWVCIDQSGPERLHGLLLWDTELDSGVVVYTQLQQETLIFLLFVQIDIVNIPITCIMVYLPIQNTVQ